jgi:protein-S-isoprenylcysteine O-methyltransferase Ste14
MRGSMLKMRWIVFSVCGSMTSFTQARRLYRSDLPLDSLGVISGLIVISLGFAMLIYTAILLQLSVRHPDKPAVRGPYALIRNPLYLSGIVINVGLIIVATAVAVFNPKHVADLHQIALVCAGGILFFWLAACMEERYNITKFGEAYVRYAEEVPRLNLIEGWRKLHQRRSGVRTQDSM